MRQGQLRINDVQQWRDGIKKASKCPATFKPDICCRYCCLYLSVEIRLSPAGRSVCARLAFSSIFDSGNSMFT
jgi:hypothetical protein